MSKQTLSPQDFVAFESLFCAGAVRERCRRIGELALVGQANWFSINETNFQRCVKLVANTCLKNYPDLHIPHHSRWRYFDVGSTNLWQHYTQNFKGKKIELARSAVDFIFLSVLLDADAGESWAFEEPVTGKSLSKSEGLAAASLDLFFNHVARFEHVKGWIMDADSLQLITEGKLASIFQHSSKNPLPNIDERLSRLQGLAAILENYRTEHQLYNRPSNLIDACRAVSKKSFRWKVSVDAAQVLAIVLKRFGLMWPNGYMNAQGGGLNLGDCGYHSQLTTDDATDGIIPFHKLSQWLTYSLIEPLQWAGIQVVNLEELTGLAEYRNGGLLIDTGSLQPLDQSLLHSRLTVDSEAVVEWRALTVYMLDRLAIELRTMMGLSEKQLPLCSILQGGTSVAGRDLAMRLRPPHAPPPLNLVANSTIF